ncbi:sensor histidine kinase [Adhaeribacter rhizoryzae]|uniref:histidine kinase n=1 Tax=Adhaeribacter rhizoryzae TaxID=2607907 RepID=A0A5M6DF69_9BACT|nr:ATP-binding protein [Adhaeribacter rhizoryzae]KAA5544829.1 PAS domain-containing protein [Adhaeribacter rhizoryzae]
MKPAEKESKVQIKELIELNEELENYFSNTIIPQLFVDADLNLRKFTPPAMKQFSLLPEHIGRPMAEMVDHIRYSTITENIQAVINTGEILEKEIQTTDLRWFQMNIIPYLIKKQNKANGVIITFVDITERIKTLRELEKLNASHETFIYAVSHDLKAPLANIEGLVALLIETSDEIVAREGGDIEEQKIVMGLLSQSVKSMRNMIDDLSDIAKIEGNYQETVENIRFETILQEVQWTLKDKIKESQAQICIDIQAPEIKFPRKNLRSIIYNLLSNALKYTSPGRNPEVWIKTIKESEIVQLSVKDNGLGITPEQQELIFAQYARLKKEGEGTGIGLYLVKRILDNAEGKIKVQSKPGEGSEFIVYLKAGTLG